MDFADMHIFLSYKQGGIVSPYLTQTRFKRELYLVLTRPR